MTDSEKLDLLLDKVSNMEFRMTSVESRITDLESHMSDMESQISIIKTDVAALKMVVENEIRVNIQRVAEGHLDLSRNLHEAIKPCHEIEILSVKVRALESDVQEIQRKIS